MTTEKKAWMTIGIAAINMVVFFILECIGNTENGSWMLKAGAMYVPLFKSGQYYRIVTSMFLHFGFHHLVNNMFMLLILGSQVEFETGKLRFLCIYMLSGIGGNLFSMWSEIQTADYAVSAGASGAIFGMVGALLYIAIRNGGRIGSLTWKGILVMILVTSYYGFTSAGIDVMAHIGGLVCGFISAVFFYRKRYRKGSSASGIGSQV